MFDAKIDPLGFIADLIHQNKIDKWAWLLLQLGFFFSMAFTFTYGTALRASETPWHALGDGLVTATVCAVAIWRKSPLTKDSTGVLPEKEAEAELDTNLQTIRKP
jgi:hypothetical protein